MDQSYLTQQEQRLKNENADLNEEKEINSDITAKEDNWLLTAVITCKFGCPGGDECKCKFLQSA